MWANLLWRFKSSLPYRLKNERALEFHPEEIQELFVYMQNPFFAAHKQYTERVAGELWSDFGWLDMIKLTQL